MKKLFTLCFLSFFAISGFAKVIVLSGLTNQHQGKAGSVVEGEILLQNTGDKEERILVYLNDLIQACDTSTVYAAPGAHARSSSAWMEMNVSDYVLGPNEEYTVRYQMRIPADQSLQGSFWSMVMIEIEEPFKEDELQYGVTMDSKIRYGIQIITDVGERVNPEIEFVGVELRPYEGEGYMLITTTHNLGIFMVTPTVVLELYDKNAELVLKTEVPFKKVYPGSCKSFEVLLTDIPRGDYDALLVADYGKDLYGTNLELSLN